MRCARTPDCPGVVDADGFCEVCGLAPWPTRPARAATPTAGAPVGHETWPVAGLVSLPVRDFTGHRRTTAGLTVPEHERFCANPACRREVGRGGA
ncbi:hypothetical protein QLR68_37150, partial [Micromonospora sp. DH15]|nr:hypothetical protein [Micromonospora sp. DH15]